MTHSSRSMMSVLSVHSLKSVHSLVGTQQSPLKDDLVEQWASMKLDEQKKVFADGVAMPETPGSAQPLQGPAPSVAPLMKDGVYVDIFEEVTLLAKESNESNDTTRA